MVWNDVVLRPALETWAVSHWESAVKIGAIENLGGHSGYTFGFTVKHGEIAHRLVIRLAPANVPQVGNADVLRQAPLLRALQVRGIAVAAVRAASSETRFFGVPFLVVDRLAGRPLMMGPGVEAWLGGEDRQRAHCLAAATLADIHACNVVSELKDWAQPRSLDEEMNIWSTLMGRSPEAAWVETGMRLRSRLGSLMPETHTIGLCHGDYQTNNILFSGRGDRLTISGVVDWEIAGIGATELDLAWFLMMNDESAWHPVEQRGGLDLAAIVDRYEVAAKCRIRRLNWFWALACFRIAAIAMHNIRLHRSGRRPDADWERTSLSVPIFFERAFALCSGAC